MPIYEYRCSSCDHVFELLVRAGDVIKCPLCASSGLDRVISGFAVSSQTTRQSSLTQARRASAKTRVDQKHAELEAIKHHRH